MAGSSDADISDHLPLQLTKSETIPPAPNLSVSGSAVIDWLPDFSGYSWVAYGASSLLIITHFPSPLSPHQSQVGPFFRQVFDLHHSSDSSDVASVSWSPAIPSSGDLAAAVHNRIFVFHYESAPGSFCWSQSALLVQSAKMEAIAWTGSGDGILSGGKEVVLWKRNIKSWEIAWKSRMEVSQTLVSTTWSVENPSATGTYPTNLHAGGLPFMTCKGSNYVSVFQNDGKSGYVADELRHPQPVFAIQWRPSAGRQSNGNALNAPRHVLLTSCLDGAVRLWSEIDGIKILKGNKDYRDPSTSRRSFCVVAVIEINQSLNGVLGTDIFINWALDIQGLVCMSDEASELFSAERRQKDEVGRCEWLIGLGPGKMATFWAVHCLDDIATMRAPRVTLWKRQEVLGPALRSFRGNDQPRCTEGSLFEKFAIWRNRLFGPPTICSIIQLLPCNSLAWSVLYSQSSVNAQENSSQKHETDNSLSGQSGGILDTLGHTGKILQVAVHPSMSEVGLAVSLDSTGLLIFWSVSNPTNSVSGLPTFNPSWQLIGKTTLQDTVSQGMILHWAPLLLNECQILLVRHVQGIDCLVVKTCETKEEKILCHKLCTLPFVGHGHIDVPEKIISVPLHSTCKETFKFNSFLLLGVWMKNCQAELWKVTLHSHEISEICCQYNFDPGSNTESGSWIYKTDFAGKTYCMVVNSYSSYFPDVCDQVTSVAVVSPSLFMPYIPQKLDLVNDYSLTNFPYHMATGHSDGISRLWRINLSELSVSHTPFELVGMFSSFQGPITAISVYGSGQKIATLCSTSRISTANTLCIWEPLYLAGTGTVELVDKISLNGNVVALHWFLIQTRLFLGVCFQNELHIYCQRGRSAQTPSNPRKDSEASVWIRVAVVRTSRTIFDFLLGPRETIIIIHEKYFSLFNQWSFLKDNSHLIDGHLSPNSYFSVTNKMDIDGLAFFMGKIHIFEELPVEESSQGSTFSSPLTKAHNNSPSRLLANGTQPIDKLLNKTRFLKMTEAAEILCGPLPFYHPEALLMNIYSGNWKRAYVAVCHLVECLAANSTFGQRLIPEKSTPIIRQIKLSNYFEGQLPRSGASLGFQGNKDLNTVTWASHSEIGFMQYDDVTNGSFSASAKSSESCGFNEMVEKLYVLKAVTESQKMEMFAIVDFLCEISNPQSASVYESLDKPGRRFWCAIRLQQLDFLRRYSRMPSTEELVVDSRLIDWAFHSDCQANLFSNILPTEPTWEEMRKMGVGFWFTNLTDLRTKMEKLARSQYLKNKDPKACALLYIALNRLQVLAGLFKVSRDEKDKALVAFLSRNFQEEKHKAAALKNAYVLMGRHQYDLAIAFFLLGGDITSAINVCAKTLGDAQLALVICRLVEGQGGPTERHLISRILLPSAIDKGDYWLASLLEWILGNYLQSFLVLLGLQGGSHVSESEQSFKNAAFLDPSIGQCCQILAAKNSLKNAVGEKNGAVLSRWATVMTASAFNKCGLPLEALECLSSSASIPGVADKGTDCCTSEILPRILRPFPADTSRWLSHEPACHLDCQVKLDLAMQYIMTLIREHPYSLNTTLLSVETSARFQEHEMGQHGALLEHFEQNLDSALVYFEQKFSLTRELLLNKIFVSLDNDRLLVLGYHLLHGFSSQERLPALCHIVGSSSQLLKQFMNVVEYLSHSLSRFVTLSSIASSQTMDSSDNHSYVKKPYCCIQYLEFVMRGFMLSICSLRASLSVFNNGSTDDLIVQCLTVLDLCNYCIYFASAMIQRNVNAVALLLQPVLVSCTDGNYKDIDMGSLRAIMGQAVEALGLNSPSANTCGDILVTQELHNEDEKWIILAACLWHHLSKIIKLQLNGLSYKLTCNSADDMSVLDSSVSPQPDDNISLKNVRQMFMVFIEAIGNTLTHVSCHSARQLAVFFWMKVEDGNPSPTLMWLEEFSQSKPRVLHEHLDRSIGSAEVLAKFFGDPKIVSEMLAQLPIKLSRLIQWKPVRGWNHLPIGSLDEHERVESYKQEGVYDSSPSGNKAGVPSTDCEQSPNVLDSDKKGAALTKKAVPFHNPREIYRRNGELLEALCINSIEQRQGALASNKKGISFFNWDDGLPSWDTSDYIWSEADWPRNGWASPECAPNLTHVAPGGPQLELGQVTVGVGSETRLERDLTGGGAFGLPGYSGIGATGLGWGIQEDFDNFIDPPATLDNINARTLSSHPSRPFFLVGSSNTHIYLWEFGEEKAVGTYGVLPAANVPPPYALASITALKFDCIGHRFADSASDGTVCTWQLEVGGRSNVRPTESSLCFNGHASDISYVANSGSIIAAAGYSSTGVNVVIWDTLAPPTSSQASVMCHEGGASSIAVFDNDVATGSISPLIVTGGKGGDVGLHDFRYIATGKTKRHRHSNSVERVTDTATVDVRSNLSSSVGDQNRHGMLWYIPKAHSGSITKISTIPNTSLFLTGSKDGDVKLWDARRASLVFHWPKLHERHTFFQRSSQGFGGVTRVGVTDIQVISDGFLTCGGDGSVKLVQLNI